MTIDPTKHYERRYTPRGKVAHLIFDTDMAHDIPHAVCGWWGQKSYWLGTGNQDEYDKASAMIVCKRCQALVHQRTIPDEVGRAMSIAARVHRGQLDKAGLPYITAHVADVAARVAKAHPRDYEAQVVAWLHDTVEDGPALTLEELRANFTAEIVDAVVAITRGANEWSDDYYARVKANPLALRVKLDGDLPSNSDPQRLALLDEATRDRLAAKYAHALEMLT